MDADVIIVARARTGLMLAGELRLAGVRPLVLERRPEPREIPRANGLGGQILQLLRYRGLLDRLEAASPNPHPAPIFPFGGVHLDLSHLADPPLQAMSLPQPQLERLLGERASELGAVIQRGHEVAGLSQDDAAVTADVRGPDGPYRLTARFLVGCDGGRSPVRNLAGIPFPGTTYPEANRLGEVTLPDSVTMLENGDLDITGLGRIRAGFTRTEHGVFAFGRITQGGLLVHTTEEEPGEVDDDAPMTLAELLRDSIRRVLGADLPLAGATRLSRWQFQARQAGWYRDGRILLAGDAAHLLPATCVAPTSACSTRSTLPGSWEPMCTAGRRPACWTPITTSATRPAHAPCCRPRLRWPCGAGRTQRPKRFGTSSPNCWPTSSRSAASGP